MILIKVNFKFYDYVHLEKRDWVYIRPIFVLSEPFALYVMIYDEKKKKKGRKI